MRSLAVRSFCLLVNFLLGDAGSRHDASAELDLRPARTGDPYFEAFRARCMQWVYGDDPRKALEQERLAG